MAGHALPVIFNPCRKFSKIGELLWSLFSFLFFMPAYIHSFIIFSFCRIDDLSWGTKGSNKEESGGKEEAKA